MTLKKIAKLANVSVSTVSRALNNSFDINPKTREHVLKIAEEQGYFHEKKRVKMENRRKSSVNAAIICPEILSIHYTAMATELKDEFLKRGAACSIFFYDFDNELFGDILKNCIATGDYNAIICLNTIRKKLNNINIPIVVFDGIENYSVIKSNYIKSVEIATEYLVKKGKKNIAFAGESYTRTKANVFTKKMEELNLKPFGVFESSMRFEKAGEEIAKMILEKKALPDGILCAYDEIAFGVISTFLKNGIRVPQDVGVIGLNDIPSSEYFFGGLTTIAYDRTEVFKKIIDDIFEATLKRHFTPKTYESKIVIRERSTL